MTSAEVTALMRGFRHVEGGKRGLGQCAGMSLERGRDCRPGGHTIRKKEASTLNLWKRYVARRHQKQHERIEAELTRQKALAGEDAQEAVRNVAHGSAASQGTFGPGH
jgi:hypothetical protein